MMKKSAATFIGIPCKKGGHTLRYVATGNCVQCRHNYYLENRALAERQAREWYEANKPRKRATHRAWVENNRSKMRGYVRKWYAANSERVLDYNRDYRAAHPEYTERCNAMRRERERNAGGDRAALRAFQKWVRTEPIIPCAYCGAETSPSTRHKDHYVPLAKGGSNDLSNLRVACARCNLTKSTKLPHEFHPTEILSTRSA